MLQINVVPSKGAVVVVHPTPGIGDATTLADALRLIPNGGDVIIRDGTYNISAGLTIPPNTKLHGAGRDKVTINMVGAFTLFTTTGGYFCVADITVQGDDTSAQIVLNTDHDVDIECSDFNQVYGMVSAVSSNAEVSISDGYISLAALAGSGIFLWKGATGGELTFGYVYFSIPIVGCNIIEGPTPASVGCDWRTVQTYTGSGGPTPNFYYLQHVSLVHSDFQNVRLDVSGGDNKVTGCEFIFSSLTLRGAGNQVCGCRFENWETSFPQLSVQVSTNIMSDTEISGCSFDGVSFSGSGRGISIQNSKGVVVSGCSFTMLWLTAIELFGGGSPTPSAAVVVGCNFASDVGRATYELGPECIGTYSGNYNFKDPILAGERSTVDADNLRNVRTWGAVGDGTTDDRLVIQSAIDSLHEDGGIVFFPPGTYKIGATLSLPDKHITLKGCGDSSVLDISAGSFPAFTISALSVQRDYTITDLKILGGGGGTATPVGGALVGATLNNTFASAPSITGGNGTFAAGSTAGFTKEVGEPNHGVPSNVGGRSGWFEWTAPASGTCTIDLSGSTFDTLLSIYTGVTVGGLTFIAGDDDSGSGATSMVSFVATMGTSYKIAIDGFGAAFGSVTFTMTLIAGSAATTNSVVSIGEPDSLAVVRLERVNAYEVQYPIKVTDGGIVPVLINVTDCYFQQLEDNSSILIVNSPDYPFVTLNMDKVRFYRDYQDTVVGSLAQGGFLANLTNVNFVAKGSYFAHGSVDCTLAALNLLNCYVFNAGVGTNKRICVTYDNFFGVQSEISGCRLTSVDFDLSGGSGTGTHFSDCYIASCGFHDSALSTFDSCYIYAGGAVPADAVISSDLGGTIIKGCYFENTTRSYSVKRAAVVEGCIFLGNTAANLAYIFLDSLCKTTITGNYFRPLQGGTAGVSVAGIHLSGATECVVSNNRFDKLSGLIVWSVPPILEDGAADSNIFLGNKGYCGGLTGTPSTFIGPKSVVEGENVQSVAVTTTLDESHRTVRVDASGASRTINLPAAATYRYKKYTVNKIDSSANAVVIDPSGAELINGVATFNLTVQYQSLTFVSNGTGWDIV